MEGDPAGDNLRLTNQIHPPVSSHQSSTSWIYKENYRNVQKIINTFSLKILNETIIHALNEGLTVNVLHLAMYSF